MSAISSKAPRPTATTDATVVTRALHAYRLAAATVASFRPAELLPVRPPRALKADDARAALIALLRESRAVDEGRWMLDDDSRSEELSQLLSAGPKAVRAALAVNGGGRSWRQRLLEAWLTGDNIDLDALGPAALRAASRVREWLADIDRLLPRPLPLPEAIEGRLRQKEFLEPLERAAAQFFDRKEEMSQLEAWLDSKESSMVLWGPGGYGKSALAASFLLQVIQTQPARPWAYLNFDDVAHDPLRQLGLLKAILRQLGAQHPRFERRAAKLRRDWSHASHAKGEHRTTSQQVGQLARLLEAVAPADGLLLVLDTFEEVQFAGEEAAASVRALVEQLAEAHPALKVVYSSRVPYGEHRHLRLAGFEPPDAAEFLQLRVDALEPPLSQQDSARIVGAIGSSPLVLLLVARVIEAEGTVPFHDLADEPTAHDGLHEHIARGVLYKRILLHLHDEDPVQGAALRRIAHLSLCLQRVTADAVQHILLPELEAELASDPAALPESNAMWAGDKATLQELKAAWAGDPADLPDSRWLLTSLQREVAFMDQLRPAADERGPVLRHRPELRAMLAPSLRVSLGAAYNNIHERAAAFYQRRPSAMDRAQEVFHLICLGRDDDLIASILPDADRRGLALAAETLGAKAQGRLLPYLATAPSFHTSSPRSRGSAQARGPEHDAYVAERAEALLLDGRPKEAIFAIEAARDGESLQLQWLAAQALAAMDRHDDAWRATSNVFDTALRTGNASYLRDAAVLLAEQAHAPGEARLKRVRRALESGVVARPIDRLHLFALYVELTRGVGGDEREGRTALLETLNNTNAEERQQRPGLHRALVRAIGTEHVNILLEALELEGLPEPMSKQHMLQLARGLARWETEHVELTGAGKAREEYWYNAVAAGSRSTSELLSSLFHERDPSIEVIRLLVAMLGSHGEPTAPASPSTEVNIQQLLLAVFPKLREARAFVGQWDESLLADLPTRSPVETFWYQAVHALTRRDRLIKLLEAVQADERSYSFRNEIADHIETLENTT